MTLCVGFDAGLANDGTDGIALALQRGRELLGRVADDLETDLREALQAAGYAVEWHDYPMQHSVCVEEIGDISRWLSRVLG